MVIRVVNMILALSGATFMSARGDFLVFQRRSNLSGLQGLLELLMFPLPIAAPVQLDEIKSDRSEAKSD